MSDYAGYNDLMLIESIIAKVDNDNNFVLEKFSRVLHIIRFEVRTKW